LKLQRISALARADLKKLRREPAALFLVILFPLVLTLAFGVAFGAVGGQSTTYQVGVVNLDSVTPPSQWSQYLIGNITSTKVLVVSPYVDNSTAQADLVQGKIQAVLIIPADFSESCISYWAHPTNSSLWINATIGLYLDSGSLFATQAIPPMAQQVLAATLYGSQKSSTSGPLQIGSPSLIQASKNTMFDYMAPGLFAFSAIFLIMIVAETFTVEREQGYLRRISTTPTTPTEFILSRAVSNMVTGLLQVAVVFLMAYLVGFHTKADAVNLIMAFIVMAFFALCCVGFGLIAATIAKSPGAATGISFIFIIPLMFLGTFVFVGSSSVQAVSQFVPSYYVTNAMTSLLLRGAPVSSPAIILDLAVISISSMIVLSIGILLFRKYGKA
jgi:ABC-2 type transport system permease protein